MSTVTESVQQSATLNVDTEAGIIRDVKICGNQSKNGRIYPAEVLEAGKALYEGTPVYLNHGLEPGDEREIDVHFGNLQNVRVKEGELFGDLHYLKSHQLAASIVERAQRFPKNFGLSHDAEIEAVQEGNTQRVTSITGVNSVDLVTRPATNNGIFESERKPMKKVTYKQVLESLPVKNYPGKHRVLENMEMAEDPMLQQPVEVEEMDGAGGSEAAIKAAFRQMVMAVFDDDSLDTKATSKKIGDLLKQQDKLMTKEAPAAPPTSDTTTEMEDDDTETDEVTELDESNEDETTSTKATESWKKRALAAENKLAKSNKDKVIESVCKEQKVALNDRLRKTLASFETREQMTEYLDGGDVAGGVLESQSHPIHAVDGDSFEGYEPPKDREDFLTRITSPV